MSGETPAPLIGVEVAFALPGEQAILALRLPVGSTAAQAVAAVADRLPAGVATDDLGIFGRRVAADRVLRDGDRVELYRPLKADPKTVRRELARLGKSMGSRTRADQADGAT
jgi:hypothetical protein